MIKRYLVEDGHIVSQDDNGTMMLYTDHAAEMEKPRAQLEVARRALERIESLMTTFSGMSNHNQDGNDALLKSAGFNDAHRISREALAKIEEMK